ncbi:Thioredoxin, conserved site [Phytophthora cactorum]|nr:Thioredoxin, conserved site [Phytophthora cactorum]
MTVKTLLLAATMTAVASARQPRDNSPLFTTEQCQVRTLNSEGHAAMLADSSTVWLVDYYAPWCPHCRQFAPAWEKAAAFYADNADINIAAVDCTQNSEVCNKEGIMGYPTIKLYHVPPESTEPVKMPSKNRKNTNTMKEHGMKTSADTRDIDVHIEKINNGCEMGTITNTAKVSKTVEHAFNDQSMEMKYKRLHDAGIAAVSTFENGFYVGTTVLEGERYDAAVTWVEALATSFPMAGNRAALSSLKNWAYCTTYTCGVWTLFHTLSVSEPSEVMAAIRLFFSCEECQRHFMMANPESLLEKLAESDAEVADSGKLSKCYVNDGEPLNLNPARLQRRKFWLTSRAFSGIKTRIASSLTPLQMECGAAMSIMQRYSSVTMVAVAALLMLPFMLRSKKASKTEKTD